MVRGRCYGSASFMTAVETESSLPALVPTPTGGLVVDALPAGAEAAVKLSLIIPTYNESKNVGELVERLTKILEEPLGGSYELIIVDDDSKDRTWEVALGLCQQYPKLRVMRRVGEWLDGRDPRLAGGTWQACSPSSTPISSTPPRSRRNFDEVTWALTWWSRAETSRAAASRTGPCTGARCRAVRSSSVRHPAQRVASPTP